MSGDVLIIGAGPVGLINALLLAKAGVSVTVIDGEDGIVDSPRAMTYAWSVLDGLEYHGLLDDMMEAGFLSDYRSVRVFQTGEVIYQDYSALNGFALHPYSLTLGQNRLAEVVLKQLNHHPNARVRWNTRFVDLAQSDDAVTVTVETGEGREEIRAPWVIGADGGRSNVRKAIGLDFAGVTWPRRFVATNVYYPFEQYNYPSGYLMDPQWGAVITQITPEGMWRVTYSEDETLPLESVRERIDAYYRHVLPGGGEGYDLQLYSAYSMHQRTAATYRVGRVLLCGDAAHITNPTSGFGLVGGMYDSFCLAEALAAVVKDGADDEILDRYARARRTVYLTVTSPVSADSMRLIFYCDQPQRLEHDLITMRARGEDKAAMRQSMMAPAGLETPSLVDGKTFRQRLAERGRVPEPDGPDLEGKMIRPGGPIRVGAGAQSLV